MRGFFQIKRDPVLLPSGSLFFSVRGKIFFLFCFTSFFTVFFIGSFFYKKTAELSLENQLNKLAAETSLMPPLLQATFSELGNDVLALSKTPPVQGLIRSIQNGGIDPFDGSTTSLWVRRLETIFESVIGAKPNYVQIRYIGVSDKGRELVRVNRNGDVIERVIKENLQQKGQEPYFKKALQLSQGRVYFSVVSLNREHGKIQDPFLPVIRAFVPVYDQKGRFFGTIIINAAYKKIFENLLEALKPDKDLYIINEAGDFLIYQKDGKNSGFSFGKASDSIPEYSLLSVILNDKKRADTVAQDIGGKAFVFHYIKIFFDLADKSRFVAVVLKIPQNEMLVATYKLKKQAFILAGILIVTALSFGAFLSFVISHPLQQMTKEIRKFDGGSKNMKLPVHLRDEVGELARAFRGLVLRLESSRNTEKRSALRLQAVLDNTVEGLITIDEDGTVQNFNKACEEIFGYAPEEVLGKNIKMLMPQRYAAHHDQYLKNYREGGEAKIIGLGREVEAMRKDGSIFPIDLSVAEVFQEKGKRIFSGIVRDITERKDAEREIMRSNEELERFAYIASHDLQEPLRMVSNFTKILQEEYVDDFGADASEYMRFIIDGSQRMQDLVGALLEYSRIDHEEEEFTAVDSLAQTKIVLANLQCVIEDVHARVRFEELPVVQASPVHFARLMQNLIGNALKYRAEGRVPEIYIRATDIGTEWLFSVADNGIGMKEKYLNQIFIIFKRLHGRNRYGGTGIGLAVCKKIVEGFGGRIWAESVFGEGSTFYFTLPKKRRMKEAA